MTAAVAAASGAAPDAPAADLEKAAGAGTDGAAQAAAGGEDKASGAGVVDAVVRRWRRQDLLDRSGSALRAAAWVLSLLAFVVMAANEHGDWRQFDHYEEYRYVVAIALLVFIYTTLQLVRHGIRLTSGQDLQGKVVLLVDFAGDQVAAYLLMSALSAAIPITNRMRKGADNIFTDSSAASISMAFFAFVCLALAALISGFRLAKQAYI